MFLKVCKRELRFLFREESFSLSNLFAEGTGEKTLILLEFREESGKSENFRDSSLYFSIFSGKIELFA